MLLRTKKSLISLLVMICALLFATVVTALTQSVKAYAYTTEQLDGATVIDIYNEDTKKFKGEGLNNLALNAGYSDLNAMISAATDEGTALSPKFTDTAVQLGVDRTAGGSDLKWVPVYLSRSSDGDAILTLWLATDIYKSTWSDGTFSTNATQTFNDNTIFSNTYDGSFIRHKLNGKTGWTTSWGSGSNQSNANENIGTMVSDFYGIGELSSYVVTPSMVSWQTGTGSNRMKNDPDWAGNASLTTYYPCDWVNDNVWLPSMYEVYDKDITANSTAKLSSLTADGGLWDVKVGNVNSLNDSYSWLRSGNPIVYYSSCLLGTSGNYGAFDVGSAYSIRPALHINLNSVAQNTDHMHVWGSADNDGWIVTAPATCVSKGLEERKCSAEYCPLPDSKETRETDIDANAHSWGEWTLSKAATCTENGEETRVCAHNNAHKEKRETDANGHNWDPESVRVQPTCTTDGAVTGTCIVCGAITIETLPALGHDNVRHEAKAATCTQIGWNAFETCSRCDYSTYAEIAALGHVYATEFTVDTAATCTEKGSKSKHCTRCDEKSAVTEIPFAPHILTHVARVEPTSQADGNIEYWECSICAKKFSDGNGENVIDNVVIKFRLVKPDDNGGENQVVVTTPDGFTPDIELIVTEIAQENYGTYEAIANSVNGEIGLVYDITLKSNGVTIQPDGTLTINLLIPTDLRGKIFKIFHLHGNDATETKYNVDGNYAVVTADRLSEFIFVGEKTTTPSSEEGNGLSDGAIAGITIGVIVAVLLATYISLYFTLYRRSILKGKAFDAIYMPMNAIFNKTEQNARKE